MIENNLTEKETMTPEEQFRRATEQNTPMEENENFTLEDFLKLVHPKDAGR